MAFRRNSLLNVYLVQILMAINEGIQVGFCNCLKVMHFVGRLRSFGGKTTVSSGMKSDLKLVIEGFQAKNCRSEELSNV